MLKRKKLRVKPMTNVIPFKFNSAPIRVVERDGIPMFIAKDVASLLGYSNVNDAIKRHCEGVVKHDLPSSSGIQSFSLIPEFDVYALILRSKLPEAKKFRRWVCEEVLPSIRKTGSYTANQPVVPQTLPEALRLAADLAEKLEDAKPKIAFAESVNSAINSVSIRDFAKVVGTGQNKLYSLMRSNGYLMSSFKDRNKPYQKYIDQGLFKLQENVRTDQSGEQQVWFKTLITAKGQMYFSNKYFSKAA